MGLSTRKLTHSEREAKRLKKLTNKSSLSGRLGRLLGKTPEQHTPTAGANLDVEKHIQAALKTMPDNIIKQLKNVDKMSLRKQQKRYDLLLKIVKSINLKEQQKEDLKRAFEEVEKLWKRLPKIIKSKVGTQFLTDEQKENILKSVKTKKLRF